MWLRLGRQRSRRSFDQFDPSAVAWRLGDGLSSLTTGASSPSASAPFIASYA